MLIRNSGNAQAFYMRTETASSSAVEKVKAKESALSINRKKVAVLSKCRIGQFCRVKGVVDDCKDSGECSEILRVTSADQMDGQQQGETKTTLWYHNGSLVSLVADGPFRKFYYKEPRQEMLAVGARPGSLLFSGKSDGKKYVGTAYIFNRGCGQVPYQVSGPILDNYQSVVLRGQAPRSRFRLSRQRAHRRHTRVQLGSREFFVTEKRCGGFNNSSRRTDKHNFCATT